MSLKPSQDFRESIAKDKNWSEKTIAKLEAEVYGGRTPESWMVLDLIEQLRRARGIALQVRLPGTTT